MRWHSLALRKRRKRAVFQVGSLGVLRRWTTHFCQLGSIVSYHADIPGGAPVLADQPYVSDKNWVWAQTCNTNLRRNGWVTLTAVVAPNATLPFKKSA